MAPMKSDQPNQIENAQVFYNQYWQNADYINFLKLERLIAILEEISYLHIKLPSIIDLGCGTGWLASILGNIGPTTGVDLSDVAMQTASNKYPYVEFIQANIQKWIPPERGVFDIVVSQEVIEHLEDQKGHIRLASELLKSHGYLILTTPNARTFGAMPDEQRQAWLRQPIENIVTIKQLTYLLKDHFDIIQLRTIIPLYGQKGIYRVFSSVRLRSILRKANLGQYLFSLKLRLGLGLHILAVGKKKS